MVFKIKNKNKTRTVKFHYNLLILPAFHPEYKTVQLTKKKRALCWSIILLVYRSNSTATDV